MRRGVAFAVAALGTLLLAPGASASTQVGNVCTAGKLIGNTVLIQLANESSALPIESPAGVVTEWKVTSSISTSTLLKVVAPTGPENTYRLVAESTEQEITPGVNSFAVRIPVPAGARFGLFAPPGPGGALYCESTKSGDVMGFHSGDLLVTDAPEMFGPAMADRVAVSAVVEPDVDGDGFGDETQDKCPQSAAFQAACPQIALEVFPVVEKSSVTLIVISDHEAPVAVSANAVIPKAAKAKKKKKRAASSATVTIDGGSQTVVPNHLSQYKLKFPSKLKSALKSLPAKKSMTLTITATATNLVGQTATKATTVKLKGQAKPKAKAKSK
ncbi:MAG TPA: hypothetical protein VH476_08855 [Solirubrobacterales bacterium]|jgi:hypothetical protein